MRLRLWAAALVMLTLVLLAAVSEMARPHTVAEDDQGWCDKANTFVCP